MTPFLPAGPDPGHRPGPVHGRPAGHGGPGAATAGDAGQAAGHFRPPAAHAIAEAHRAGFRVELDDATLGERLELDKLDMFVHKFAGLSIPRLVMKVVVFDQRDLEIARVLRERYIRYISDDDFYLSLGNPVLSGTGLPHLVHVAKLLQQYRVLLEDIQNEPALSSAKFLPQLHVLLWGNKQGV